MKKRPLTAVSSLLLTAVLLCAGASAFDANDYDYGGGGYDYGGSSWDYDDDDDYSYGGGYSNSYDADDHYYGSSGGSSDMTWEETLITVAVVAAALIIVGIWANKPLKSSKKKLTAPRSRQVTVPNRNVDIRDAVQRFDPSFSSEEMLTFAKNTFIAVQDAWCAKDLEPVRGLMHNNLYSTTLRQVQAKIDQHVTYHYENYTFRNVYLTSYVRDREYEYITVYLNTQYIDYQVDDNTGSIIRGDKTTMWKMRYLMKFMRSVERRPDQPKYCPNCGAPLDIASSGKCGYCGSTVTSGSFDWLLSDFTTVRNDTKDDGIRI
ncbi:MAG: TIM44-like domain-containing protein [Ruminiclostridium sp.]|nr:TIM44-like domain-containing protein [Ruminiclostridium sp.]